MKHLSRRSFLELTPAMLLAGSGAACGYSLAGRGSFLPSYIRVLGIPMFNNRTPYPTLEQIFTEKVRVEFQGRGRYSVNPSETGADGIVLGDILAIGAAPVGYTDQQLASRYRFNVVVGVQFFDAKQKAVLWENPSLNFSDEYQLASSNQAGTGIDTASFLDRERAALDRLSDDFARTVVTAILEAF
jgi:hypothetical protein